MSIKIFREFLDDNTEDAKPYRSLTTILNPVLFIPGTSVFKKCGSLSVIESLIFVLGSFSGLIVGVMFSNLFLILVYFPITIFISYLFSFSMAYLRNKKPRMYLQHRIWQKGIFSGYFGVKNIFYDKQKTTIYRP